MVDISIEDIEQSIVTALSELREIDGIELRKVVDTEGCLDQSQLKLHTLTYNPDCCAVPWAIKVCNDNFVRRVGRGSIRFSFKVNTLLRVWPR